MSSNQKSSLYLNFSAAEVLWRRDIVRFFRQRSRVVGALAQPVLMWFVLGSGLSGSFRGPGMDGLNYSSFFYPGVVVMIVLFTAIFSTISVIEDRHEGFMQAVIASPSSRLALVVGKVAGATTIAFIQASLFIALAPLAGYPYSGIDWPLLATTLVMTGFSLTGLGFLLAWVIDNTQGYHAVMMVVLLPLWFLSGAAFPVEGASRWMQILMKLNPVTYTVEVTRYAISGSKVSPAVQAAIFVDTLFLLGFTVAMLGLSAWFTRRRT